MPTPSLLIVPARFKSGKLYSQIPTSGAGDFTVTRATSATRVNASGLIEVQKTNLAFNSADFTASATWASGANTISANVTATLDPFGTNTAEKIIPTAVSATHFISSVQSIAITSGTNYTVSVFAKAGGYDFLRIAFSTEIMPTSNRGASFNLTSGTVGDTQAGVTARIENYGNGWYRCSISRAATTSTTPSSVFFFNSQNSDSATSVTFTGDGTSGAFLWGAQLEEGTSASEYIPTTTVARTRFAGVTVDGTVATNIPRLDYLASGGTVGCPALLVEPSGTNQCQRSEEFNNAFHFPFNLNAFGSGSVANTTATLDPYGTNVADYIQENSAAGVVHGIIDVFAGNVSGTTFTWSVFAKAAERTIINLFNNGGGGGSANFNLITGVATLVGGVSASMQNYGNGWWRCVLTYTSIATGNHNVQIRLCDASGNSTYNGTGNQGAYIFGAQLEVGSVATSYIPTTTAAVTRNADVVSVSGAVSGSIGQTSGTFYIDLSYSLRLTSTATRWFQVFGSSNNIGLAVAGTNVVRSIVNGQSDILSTPSTSGGVKIAWGYDGSGVVCFVNGTQYTLTNGGAQIITQLNQIFLDLSFTPNIGNCRLRAMALYTTRLTNAELAALTTP